MTRSLLTDEHVPRVFVTTLRSNGYPVVRAKEVFGESTVDERLLRHCARENHVFVTHDRTDFAGVMSDRIDHSGILIYTDANYLRDEPEDAVETVERAFRYLPPDELENRTVWLEQWRE